jgi:2-polyprenyl-3-methyl-5-hydroxy-6-metoxy-1,4-benzoquinol methylase
MHAHEIESGRRFEFGKNWERFLRTMSDERLAEAERALADMLGNIHGKTFLDIGCGSGLSSLAAHRLGAKVFSFDYDPQSVACTQALQMRYGVGWHVAEASVLDSDYLNSIGRFDIVYSWGVLHHTGNMNQAFENTAGLVKEGGMLFLAIYNDQGGKSRRWRLAKRTYNALPSVLKLPYMLAVMLPREALFLGVATARLKPHKYFTNLLRPDKRGMNRWYDMIDWIGGYPFEVSKPEGVFAFFRDRGFQLSRMITQAGGLGCNEFVFVRCKSPASLYAVTEYDLDHR